MVWAGSWYLMYREITHWHHVRPSLALNPPEIPGTSPNAPVTEANPSLPPAPMPADLAARDLMVPVQGVTRQSLQDTFKDDREKLGRAGRAIVVEHAVLLKHRVRPQVGEIARQHFGPAVVARFAAQVGRAIVAARFAVELVGELVQHDVLAIGRNLLVFGSA